MYNIRVIRGNKKCIGQLYIALHVFSKNLGGLLFKFVQKYYFFLPKIQEREKIFEKSRGSCPPRPRIGPQKPYSNSIMQEFNVLSSIQSTIRFIK